MVFLGFANTNIILLRLLCKVFAFLQNLVTIFAVGEVVFNVMIEGNYLRRRGASELHQNDNVEFCIDLLGTRGTVKELSKYCEFVRRDDVSFDGYRTTRTRFRRAPDVPDKIINPPGTLRRTWQT